MLLVAEGCTPRQRRFPETEFAPVVTTQETGMTNSMVLSAFKRVPSLDISTWYMGSLLTYLADAKETGGAFGLIDAVLKPGTNLRHTFIRARMNSSTSLKGVLTFTSEMRPYR
jgi:hypothetical protein